MINFTYDKYALPRVESLVKAGVREAPHYAVPAEIIDALYSTKAIVDRSILTTAQEFGADKSLLKPTSRPLDQFEMLQTVVSTVNNIDHSLAAIVQEAADDDRFVLRQVDDRQPLPARFGLDAFSWDGRPMVSCDTNGTIGCLRVAMEMAGYLIGLERLGVTEIPKEKVTRTEMISFHTQSQFMARVLFDVFNLPQSQSHLMGDLKKDERASTIVYTNSWFEAYETSQTAQKLSNTLVFSGNDFDNLLSCSGLIHGELDAPAYFIATALYEAYSGKTKADQKIFLDTLYPTSGQNGETGGLPKLNTLLALAGAVDKASLNQLFTNTADSLFPASQSPVRQTFGLVIPTASEIERYGH